MSNRSSSKPARPPASLQWRLLIAFLLLAVVPLAAVGVYVSRQIEEVRSSVNRAATVYERRAQSIAGKVSELLRQCETDLKRLAEVDRNEKSYSKFSRTRKRKVWIRGGTNERMTEERLNIPLYKEVSLIGLDGKEKILIRGEEAAPPSALRDVSDPANTTYKSERYFLEAMKLKPGEIYVSHLAGFHVDKFDQLGLEKIISRLDEADDRTKRIYRYLMYEALKRAGSVEYVSSFDEDGERILVYREAGKESRILVVEPKDASADEMQARETALWKLVNDLDPEAVVEGERYDGAIRFAMPTADKSGAVDGVVSLALDHAHLMQFTQHIKAMKDNAVVFAGYRGADYAFLFDDEGWIITHPKLWDIRGVDGLGRPVPAYGEKSSEAEKLVGRIPVNLLQLDWSAGAGYHKVVLEPRQGKTGTVWHFNLGRVPRTRIYSPIFYATGPYAKWGIFGGVMLGIDSQSFISLIENMNSEIAARISRLKKMFYIVLAAVMLVVAALSIATARSLVKPIKLLGEAAERVGKGDLDTPIPSGRRDEIGALADSFSEMVDSLKSTFRELEGRNEDLKEAQKKLIEAEREKQRELEREVVELQREIASASFAGMVSASAEMKRIQEEIARVAPSSATVLIMGDNGTGKELVAEAIHKNSQRRDKKFLKVNCAALNDNLLESELFGHVKGAFTGATGDRKGLFESADGGTLLLDEIGDMSVEMQKKLLRTLQEGEVVPLGSSRVVKVDVRLIAATNRDLDRLMKEGKFREDLFHRLNVIQIRIPPLRERRDDIPALARLFIQRFADGEGKPIVGMTAGAERLLLQYHWPGNVRELENAVERAVIRASTNLLTEDDFQLTQRREGAAASANAKDRDLTLEEIEKEHILSVLAKNDGNKRLTAEILGIGYNTLWRKLKKYDDE